MSQLALDEHLSKKYEQGFTTEVEAFTLSPGLDESVITKISNFKKTTSSWAITYS